MGKADSLFTRMRWKYWHTQNPGKEVVLETFGFKTTMAPPAAPELKEFESDLCDLLKNIKYVTRQNDFQQKMKSDLDKLRQDGKVIVSADETTNLYKFPAEEYMRTIENEVTENLVFGVLFINPLSVMTAS